MINIIEKKIVDFLKKNTDVYVATEYPDRDVEQFYCVNKTGGSGKFLKKATIVLQSCSNVSMADAALLHDSGKKIMEGLIEDPDISCLELTNDYEYSNEKTKYRRYQAVFEIGYY